MNAIVILPAMLAVWVAFDKGPYRALVLVYLPVLFLLPEYYRFNAPGLPDPTFGEAAAIAVGLAYLARGAPGWRFSLCDILVFSFAAGVFYSEFRAAGYKEAQNLLFDMLGWVVFPYILGKGLIEPNGQRVEVAKRIVWLTALVSVLAVYEFLMGMNQYRLVFDPFFPGQGRGWVTTFRWGFARVAGPYGHAILAGLILVCVYRLQRWLQWEGHWPRRIPRLEWLPLSMGAVMTLVVLGGVVMSMVRGPWIGGFLAAAVILVGRSKQRVLTLAVGGCLALFVGLPLVISFINYASVGRENAKTVAQESAAYRYELIENYVEIASEESLFGWGRNTWPKVPGQPSIDNYYLLLTLMHGLFASGLLLLIMVVTMLGLLRKGLSVPADQGLFTFTLLSLYPAIGFSIATVFLGLNTMPFFFFMTGWAQGYLKWGQPLVGAKAAEVVAEVMPVMRFRKVLA
ncbi:MAG: O-antigen ligase family protein [Acidobacteriota bacterium]